MGVEVVSIDRARIANRSRVRVSEDSADREEQALGHKNYNNLVVTLHQTSKSFIYLVRASKSLCF